MISININNFSHISYSTRDIYKGGIQKAYDPYLGVDYTWNGGGRERTPNGFINDFKIYDMNCNIVPCIGDPHVVFGSRNGYYAARSYPELEVGRGGNDNPIIAGGLVIGNNVLYDRIKYLSFSGGKFTENVLSSDLVSAGFRIFNNGSFVFGGSCYYANHGAVTIDDMRIDADFGVKFGFYNKECWDHNNGNRFLVRWYANPEPTWTGNNNMVYTPKNFYYASDPDIGNFVHGYVTMAVGLFVRRYFDRNTVWGDDGNDEGYIITPVAFTSIDYTGYYFFNNYMNGTGKYRYPVFEIDSPFISDAEYQAAKCSLGLDNNY